MLQCYNFLKFYVVQLNSLEVKTLLDFINIKQIKLVDSVNWKVGDEVVIASTGLRHSQNENEKRFITAISTSKYYYYLI